MPSSRLTEMEQNRSRDHEVVADMRDGVAGLSFGCGGSAALPVSLLVYLLLQTCPARVEVPRHKSMNTSLLEPAAPQGQKSSSNNSLCALGSSSYMGHTGVLLLEQNCCIFSTCLSFFFLFVVVVVAADSRALYACVCCVIDAFCS